MSSILNKEARKLESIGIDLIQFDEPAFNVFFKDVKSHTSNNKKRSHVSWISLTRRDIY